MLHAAYEYRKYFQVLIFMRAYLDRGSSPPTPGMTNVGRNS
jgi:hypothetical protein